MFDVGQYVVEDALRVGNPPPLFRSKGGKLVPSDELTLAVSAYQGCPGLHAKNAIAGAVDGDLDLWVESTGGDNLEATSCSTTSAGRRSAWTRTANGGMTSRTATKRAVALPRGEFR